VSTPNGLHDGFDANLPQSEDEVDEALKTGLLSLDANVLLNFYRFSPKAREALVDVLKAAGDRVWVSHQAAREFWRNRCSAIDGRSQATEQLRASMDKNEASALQAVETWAKQTAVPEDVKKQVREHLEIGFSKARELFEEEVRGAGQISYDGSTDSVLAILTELLPSHVGAPLAANDHAEALEEGSRRAEAGLPPGFLDADKAGNGADGASGDYLVWLQSIEEATRRNLPLVVVTGDEKEDWWWKHRGVLMGPRQELVVEFAEHSDHRLFMLRPVQLISHASALDVAVSEEAAQDVARASSSATLGLWNRRAVHELLRRLELENWVHARIIRAAARQGGVIDREQVYEIAGYDEDRMLRGFTRPTARITKALQDEGLLSEAVEPALTTVYEGGVLAVRFEIPLEMVEILSLDGDADLDGS